MQTIEYSFSGLSCLPQLALLDCHFRQLSNACNVNILCCFPLISLEYKKSPASLGRKKRIFGHTGHTVSIQSEAEKEEDQPNHQRPSTENNHQEPRECKKRTSQNICYWILATFTSRLMPVIKYKYKKCFLDSLCQGYQTVQILDLSVPRPALETNLQNASLLFGRNVSR